MVVDAFDGDAVIEHCDDPRVEKQEHYYRAAHTKLLDLGLVPHLLSPPVFKSMLAVCDHFKRNVNVEAILPTVEWRATSSNLVTAGSGMSEPALTPSARLNCISERLALSGPAGRVRPTDRLFDLALTTTPVGSCRRRAGMNEPAGRPGPWPDGRPWSRR